MYEPNSPEDFKERLIIFVPHLIAEINRFKISADIMTWKVLILAKIKRQLKPKLFKKDITHHRTWQRGVDCPHTTFCYLHIWILNIYWRRYKWLLIKKFPLQNLRLTFWKLKVGVFSHPKTKTCPVLVFFRVVPRIDRI